MLGTKKLIRRRDQLVKRSSVSSEAELANRLHSREAKIVVMGLGYAGLPMAVELGRAGFGVVGLDVDQERVWAVNRGQSPVASVSSVEIAGLVEKEQLWATTKPDVLSTADCVLIAVPTPLTKEGEPGLGFVEAAADAIADHCHRGMLVILQSTCPPGTTRKVILPRLEAKSGLRVGHDFFLVFAPERVDPGNQRFTVRDTPKIVGGLTPSCSRLGAIFDDPVVERLTKVSSPEVAEMAKLVENAFRFVNISFVNELALLCDRMGVSIWEIIDAAATKPFAFMPHYPGPGVGGHCIPVVPFFLDAAARQYGLSMEMVELAGRINDRMPDFVIAKLERLLRERGLSLAEARILVLGVTYKANVNDTRESPALRVLELLCERGASVSYHDPYVPSALCGETLYSSLSENQLAAEHFDVALLLTPHNGVDYKRIAAQADFVFDTRGYLPTDDGIAVVRI